MSSYRAEDSGPRRALAWLQRPAPRSWSIVVFAVALGALVLYGFQLAGNHSIAERARTASIGSSHASHQAKAASSEALAASAQAKAASGVALAATAAIQQQRATALRLVCENQNRRHDATLSALHRVLRAALARTRLSSQRTAIRASRAPTVLLINALAPKRDCAHVVAARL